MTTPWRGYPRIPNNVVADVKTRVNALADAIDGDVQLLSTGYRLAGIVYFNSSGTFDKGEYAGLRAVMVECVGGGGGSGYAAGASGSQLSFGRGGAGGAFTRSWFTAGDLLSSEVVTVGAGGAGGTSGTPDGGNGEDTSFGALVTAGGGEGGGDVGPVSDGSSGSTFLRGAGGIPSGTYDIGVPGEGDGSLDYRDGSILNIVALRGGSSGGPYGVARYETQGARPDGGVGTMAPAPGQGIGGGARGSITAPSGSAQDGEAGSDGIVIVYVYL